jgi:hypothetical protein
VDAMLAQRVEKQGQLIVELNLVPRLHDCA